jgi:hypothetical protein
MIILCEGALKNKQKNWKDWYSTPPRNVEEKTKPGCILYPVSTPRGKRLLNQQKNSHWVQQATESTEIEETYSLV